MTPHFHVAIIGTGFGGLGAAIRLRQRGLEDFVVLERAADVGGVWRDNTYPGCACDVQSDLYSFSFAPNPRWTRRFAPQAEIHAYLRECAERFGVLPHVRFRHEVRAAAWDDAAQRWRIATSAGDFTADVLVAGAGALSDPAIPPLPGLERFEGPAFHSARWDHGVDLAGKRVAVIGTGASAVQFVPLLQPRVASLVVFQRTPPWVLPRLDRALRRRAPGLALRLRAAAARLALFAARELLAIAFLHPPVAALLRRYALWFLRRSVKDRALREKLTPRYEIGCKRVLVADDWFPALAQPNVEVVAHGVREVRARSVVAADGSEREVDAIVFGTGFHIADLPISKLVRGRDGRTLAETWAGSPRAHLGTTVAGFPNLFVLQGPNTGLGHTSVVLMIESQIEHLLSALDFMRARGVAAVEPAPEAQARFVEVVDRRMRGTVWTSGGCKSWYLEESGRNFTLWPGFSFTFRRRVRTFRPAEYLCAARRTQEGSVGDPVGA